MKIGKAVSIIEINQKRTKKLCNEVDRVFINGTRFCELLLTSLNATKSVEL